VFIPPLGTWIAPPSLVIHSCSVPSLFFGLVISSKFLPSMRTIAPSGGFAPSVGDSRTTRFRSIVQSLPQAPLIEPSAYSSAQSVFGARPANFTESPSVFPSSSARPAFASAAIGLTKTL